MSSSSLLVAPQVATPPRPSRRTMVRLDPFDGAPTHRPTSNISIPPLAATATCVGLDVHQRTIQLCATDPTGQIVDERRLATTRRHLQAVFAQRPRAQILLESSTDSEWVARVLEQCGHAVIVADPNFAPMYATRRKAVKTDKRDARALADACRLGAYHVAHRPSDAMRQVRDHLLVREALIRTRTRYLSVMRARLRRDGIRLVAGNALSFGARLTQLFAVGTPRGEILPTEARIALAPLLRTLETINTEILAADAAVAAIAAADPVCRRLMTMPGIGPVTATAFRTTIDEVTRFASRQQVAAYIGLVPSERSSGERQLRGPLTKRGDPRLRYLLIEAGWRLLSRRCPKYGHTPETARALATLHTWSAGVVARRGRQIAAAALARKLSGILYTMWRTGTDFGAHQSGNVEGTPMP